MKYTGMIMPLLLLIGTGSARADLLLGSFTQNQALGTQAEGFTGTFSVQGEISACIPKFRNNLCWVAKRVSNRAHAGLKTTEKP
jgi:hypothetical protein